jgi:hypothetical protein
VRPSAWGPESQRLLTKVAELAALDDTDVVREGLPAALPWTTLLPESDHEEFLRELRSASRGSVEQGDFARLALCLTQWRHSAEVYADPALLEAVTREPEADLGPVPRPPS